MKNKYSGIYNLFAVVLFLILVTSYSEKSADMPTEARDSGDAVSLQKPADPQDWNIVFRNSFGDYW